MSKAMRQPMLRTFKVQRSKRDREKLRAKRQILHF